MTNEKKLLTGSIEKVGLYKSAISVVKTVLGATKDFVLIEYLGDDKLLLPVENLHVIDRYIGESGGLVSVDRLGKGSFQKLKAKTKERLLEIASEIIAIAAKREMVDGLSLAMEEGEMVQFEADAGFADWGRQRAR